MGSNEDLTRRLCETGRERLVWRAALLIATMPAVADIEVGPGLGRVSTRYGRSVGLRFDVTVIMTTGFRIGVAVALHPSVVNAIEWPARIISSSIRAGFPQTIVALSRRQIIEAVGQDMHPAIKAGPTGRVMLRAPYAGGGRRAQVRRLPFRVPERFDVRNA